MTSTGARSHMRRAKSSAFPYLLSKTPRESFGQVANFPQKERIPNPELSILHSNRGASLSTTSFPMLSDAVAAGDGAFSTFTTRSVSSITKSSTIFPSGLTV